MNQSLSHKLRLKTSVLGLSALFLLSALLLTSILLLAGLPGLASIPTALANPISSDLEPASDELADIDILQYKIFRTPDGYAALVGGSLNEDTLLPALFEVQIPAGAEVIWFGEISGGPRDEDRIFPEPFTVHTEGDFDIYTAVTNDHVFQIEFLLLEDPFEALGAGEHVYFLSYTPLHDARALRMAAYLPPDSNVHDPSFQHIGFAPDSEDPLYGISFFDITGGQTYQAELRYGPPASIARRGSANFSESILVTIGVVAACILGTGTAFYLSKSRRARAEAELEEHADDA